MNIRERAIANGDDDHFDISKHIRDWPDDFVGGVQNCGLRNELEKTEDQIGKIKYFHSKMNGGILITICYTPCEVYGI